MRNCLTAVVIWSVGLGAGMAQTPVAFEARAAGGKVITASSVRLDGDRLATIAVMEARAERARLGADGKGEALELVGHDPVTRLTIVRGAVAEGDEKRLVRGSSLNLQAGEALYLPGAEEVAPSRLVKWETSYDGKILPVALLRVHHPGTEPPLPGTPLRNGAGELVAICHQPAPEFGNGTFALPVEVLMRIESDLAAEGKISACWIGVTVDASRTVLAIQMVRPGSPGAKAGLRKGDILLSVGPRRVESYAEARNAFYYLVAGEETPIEVLRGTQQLKLTVIPEVHPTLEGPEGE